MNFLQVTSGVVEPQKNQRKNLLGLWKGDDDENWVMDFGKAIIYLEFNTYDRNHSQNCLIELNLLIVLYGMFGNWLVSEYNDFQEFEAL